MMTRKRVRKVSDAALEFTIADLRSVIDIQERAIRDGFHCPKLGRYWDDLHLCVVERNRRNKRKVGARC